MSVQVIYSKVISNTHHLFTFESPRMLKLTRPACVSVLCSIYRFLFFHTAHSWADKPLIHLRITLRKYLSFIWNWHCLKIIMESYGLNEFRLKSLFCSFFTIFYLHRHSPHFSSIEIVFVACFRTRVHFVVASQMNSFYIISMLFIHKTHDSNPLSSLCFYSNDIACTIIGVQQKIQSPKRKQIEMNIFTFFATKKNSEINKTTCNILLVECQRFAQRNTNPIAKCFCLLTEVFFVFFFQIDIHLFYNLTPI